MASLGHNQLYPIGIMLASTVRMNQEASHQTLFILCWLTAGLATCYVSATVGFRSVVLNCQLLIKVVLSVNYPDASILLTLFDAHNMLVHTLLWWSHISNSTRNHVTSRSIVENLKPVAYVVVALLKGEPFQSLCGGIFFQGSLSANKTRDAWIYNDIICYYRDFTWAS